MFMAELREAVATREETVPTGMGYTLKERAESNRFNVCQGEEVLAVLPGIWEVSMLFYVAT